MRSLVALVLFVAAAIGASTGQKDVCASLENSPIEAEALRNLCVKYEVHRNCETGKLSFTLRREPVMQQLQWKEEMGKFEFVPAEHNNINYEVPFETLIRHLSDVSE